MKSTSPFLRKKDNQEIDVVNRRFKYISEIKFSSNYNHKWNKHLTNIELLKEFELEKFKKIGVYLGETFESGNGVTWMNIYDFMKFIGREHLLEPVNKNEINLDLNSFTWT